MERFGSGGLVQLSFALVEMPLSISKWSYQVGNWEMAQDQYYKYKFGTHQSINGAVG